MTNFGTYYEVKAWDCSWGLMDRFNTLKEAIEGAKKHNDKVASDGWSRDNMIVVRIDWSRQFEETPSGKNKFLTSSETMVRVAEVNYLNEVK